MRRCRRWMHANPRTIQHVTVVKHSFMLRTILSVVTADLGIFRFLTLRSPSGILHPLVHEAQCKHHKPMVAVAVLPAASPSHHKRMVSICCIFVNNTGHTAGLTTIATSPNSVSRMTAVCPRTVTHVLMSDLVLFTDHTLAGHVPRRGVNIPVGWAC